MAKFAASPRWSYSEASATPEPSRAGDLDGFLRLVGATGVPAPREFENVRARLAVLNDAIAEQPHADRLVAAVLDGPGDDIAALLSLASTSPAAPVVERVRAETLSRLTELWPARRAYLRVASQFDSCARRFVDLAHQVDIGAPAERIVAADRREQKAWNQAPEVAAELDALVPRLAAAAELVRGVLPRRIGTNDESLFIPLVVANVEQLHRRRLHEAFCCLSEEVPPPPALTSAAVTQTRQHPLEGLRTGRWGLLLGLGARLAACPNPARLELLPPPRGYVTLTADPAGRRITPRVIDPEDPTPPEPGPLKKLAATIGGHRFADEILGEEQ
ncbi:MAG: hypothetical protein ACXVX6_05340 [Mycobacterium sp.]